MQNQTLVLALLGFAAAIGAADNPHDRVSFEGFKGVRFGMTVTEASTAYGNRLKPYAPLAEDERSCFYVYPDGIIGPLSFMIIDDRVARVDVDGPNILTVTGVGVGSSESSVLHTYEDRVKISAHPYTGPEGHYLTVDSEDGIAIIFETDGSTVTSYRAGQYPAVRYIEGCS